MEKIMQITNANKRFTTFPPMIHFTQKFEDKVSLHPMKRSMRMLLFKMRNHKRLKNDVFD